MSVENTIQITKVRSVTAISLDGLNGGCVFSDLAFDPLKDTIGMSKQWAKLFYDPQYYHIRARIGPWIT